MRTPAPLPPQQHQQKPTENTHLLEINLISAQNLKSPPSKFRRLQTYAVAYVDHKYKLRTRIDRVGAENPNWNDKFIFRVSGDFLAGETSAVTVDIFAVGVLKDTLLGSVRFFLSNILTPDKAVGVPAFIAVQVRRPSGRYHGVLNVGAMVIDENSVGGGNSLSGVSAIGYRDMMGEGTTGGRQRRKWSHRRGVSDASSSESWGGDSDGTESTESNSSELNGRREMAGDNQEKGGKILCGLGFQCDDVIKAFGALDLN